MLTHWTGRRRILGGNLGGRCSTRVRFYRTGRPPKVSTTGGGLSHFQLGNKTGLIGPLELWHYGSMINMGDAQQKVAHAELHLRKAVRIFNDWADANVHLVYARDPRVWIECFEVFIVDPPPGDLGLTIGDFLSNAQAALDYAAWEIFLAAGGSPDHRRAGRVYFPILQQADGWTALFKDKLPMSWPDAEAAMRAEQDDQEEPRDNMFTRLSRLANSQKHRALHLIAVSPESSASFIAPEIPDEYEITMGIHLSHPPIESMSSIRLVEYNIHRADDPLALPVPRDEVISEFSKPDAPEWAFALTDGAATVQLSHLVVMLRRVRRAVDNLAKLDPPVGPGGVPLRMPPAALPGVQRVIIPAPPTRRS